MRSVSQFVWETFTEPARSAFVRAGEAAQLFGSTSIGTEHVLFGLAGGDDELGAAFARAVDREAIKERLGGATREPHADLVFTPAAKRAIELAFGHARRLRHPLISEAHVALGMIEVDPPPLVAGVTIGALRDEIERIARPSSGEHAESKAKDAT